MSLLNKIKIRIRPRQSNAPQVAVRERLTYHCTWCHNGYYDYHVFCPQCLGELKPSHSRPSDLRVSAVSSQHKLEISQILQALTSRDYPFLKSLNSLPWTMLRNTEECVAQYWKDVLDAQHATCEIIAVDPAAKRKRGKPAVFESNAELPHLFGASTDAGVRQVARVVGDPSLRMKWVDCVLAGYHILEDFYKHHPGDRVVFSEFVFHIDHDLLEVTREYESTYKKGLGNFAGRIAELQARFDAMKQEILEVRRQVEEGL